MLIKKTKIRDAVDSSVSENFFDEFNQRVLRELKDAEERAKKNERATLMARDV